MLADHRIRPDLDSCAESRAAMDDGRGMDVHSVERSVQYQFRLGGDLSTLAVAAYFQMLRLLVRDRDFKSTDRRASPTLEARAVDADEVIHRIVVRLAAHGLEGQYRRRLRHRPTIRGRRASPDDADSGQKGKKRLVDGDVLQGGDAFTRHQIEHAIDQENGIAVRQIVQYLVDVHRRHVFFSRSAKRASSTRILSAMASVMTQAGKIPQPLAMLQKGTDPV